MSTNETARRVVAIDSELGWIAVAWQGKKVAQVSLGHATPQAALASQDGDRLVEPDRRERKLLQRLRDYAAGQVDAFDDLELDFEGRTPFQRRVLEACRQVAYGQTITYADLAAAAGSPRAHRAVGNVMASNRTPVLIPCHRVLAKNSLGGFSAPTGVSLKKRLLGLEGVLARRD
ncbi:methylated-DNA--[protein]-cysteine S-methyltransferase [Lignipirellula cremea]|nr:methylated-DNA--[protein]-cysteine S-methyltransferase [Lignipirellula cremea]